MEMTSVQAYTSLSFEAPNPCPPVRPDMDARRDGGIAALLGVVAVVEPVGTLTRCGFTEEGSTTVERRVAVPPPVGVTNTRECGR
jgi:hypothetical protein